MTTQFDAEEELADPRLLGKYRDGAKMLTKSVRI